VKENLETRPTLIKEGGVNERRRTKRRGKAEKTSNQEKWGKATPGVNSARVQNRTGGKKKKEVGEKQTAKAKTKS